MHRKIYRETVAGRIEARRLALAVQKKATKAAKKATKQAAKTARQAEKAARQAAKAKIKAEKRAIQYPAEAIAPVKLIVMPESVETTRNESNLVAPAPTPSPLFRYISNSLQEFQEGVEVRIPHARRYISVAAPAMSVAQPIFPELSVVAPRAKHSLVSSSEAATENLSEAKMGDDAAGSRKNTTRRHKLFAHRPTRAELINAESRLGSTLFGSVPVGHRREFFHDRDNVWIWYEGWTEANRESRQITVRYEVRPTGVYKKLAAGKYVLLEGNELENFRRAAHAYLQLIKHNLYHLA